MSASENFDSIRRRMFADRAFSNLQDEARIANEIQRQYPDITRTAALKIARECVEARGQ